MDQNDIENERFDEYQELDLRLRRMLRGNAEESEVLEVACRAAECCDDILLVDHIILNLMNAGCRQSTVQAVIDIAKNIEATDPAINMPVVSDRIARYGALQLLSVFETLNNWTEDNPLSHTDYYNIHHYFARYMQQYVGYFIAGSARYSNLTINADPDFLVKQFAHEIAFENAHESALEEAKL